MTDMGEECLVSSIVRVSCYCTNTMLSGAPQTLNRPSNYQCADWHEGNGSKGHRPGISLIVNNPSF
jgi:hypothetical protein